MHPGSGFMEAEKEDDEVVVLRWSTVLMVLMRLRGIH